MHNNLSNPFNPAQPLLLEGLKYKDLDGMMKSTVHVDEFASKMGDDDDIIVISFFVRDLSAAKDPEWDAVRDRLQRAAAELP